MYSSHEDANSAFSNSAAYENWIEVYHSRSSWRVCQISFQKNDQPWVPFNCYKLIDASDVRPGFRAFRIQAKRLEFRLANGVKTRTDSNNGRNYVIHSPGRYVVENGEGCRRVSEAQIPDCLRPMRPNDRFVELFFETNRLWRNCFVTYSVNGDHHNEWRKIPMEMVCQSGIWFQRICATKGVTCAFNDGATDWDNNSEHNYHICLPGKYSIGGDHLVYQDPSDVDMHIN